MRLGPWSNMSTWLLIYLLLVLFLFAVALFEHINSAALSLPISPLLTIIIVALPLLAAINAIDFQRFFRRASSTTQRRALPRVVALQGFQAIVITVLATLCFSDIVPSAARRCLLSTTWQRLFSDHDAESIRHIQNALNCCGFNTVLDRPWPFPDQQSSHECTNTYRRDTACAEPWLGALQRNSGLDFGIVLAVGLLQVVTLLLPFRRVFLSRADNDPERSRLLPGVTSAGDGGDAPEHERAGQPEQYGDLAQP